MRAPVQDSRLLDALLATTRDAVVAHDAAGIVTVWNASAERLFARSADAALGRALAQVAPLLVTVTTEDAGGDDARTMDVVRSDGGHQILSVRRSALLDDDGRELGHLFLVRHSPTDPGLASSDADRLDLALAAARLGDWRWDVRTDLVTLSPRAAELFGVTPTPLPTWTELRRLIHPADRATVRQAVENAVRTQGDYSTQYRIVNGGRERWVSADARCTYGQDGAIVGMYGVLQDITSSRLLYLLDDAVRPLVHSEDITFMAARVLGQHLAVNRCAYAFCEDDEDTFVLAGNYTNGVESIVGRYRFRQFGAECLRAMRAGEPWVVEDSFADPRIDEEDRKAYVLTNIRAVICVPIRKSGKFVAAMAVHMSSQRKWTGHEVELVQQVASRSWESIERTRIERERAGLLEAAQTANRAKDEFLAMLGHELRNPLAPILTALQLMRLRGEESSARERTVIERQVEHLTRLVDDLLDVSRIARGKVDLKTTRLELVDVVSRALEVASPLLEERSHAVVVDVPRTGLPVVGDGARLTQVVSNLLTNAAKYTPSGGKITISARTDGDDVALSVRDNGVGMMPDVLAHAFDLFVQGRQSIDRAHGGLGLGLTIVRSLVERHGGTVSAHSDGRDRGSELVVRLPKARADVEVDSVNEARLPSTAPGTSNGTRVLIVDDNADAAEMPEAALTLQGCEVHVASDGPAALRLGETLAFDAALLDIGLPVMDGYELATRLRELPNLAGARLVAVTGYGQESDRRRALEAGFQHHLVKPVDLKALRSILGRLPS